MQGEGLKKGERASNGGARLNPSTQEAEARRSEFVAYSRRGELQPVLFPQRNFVMKDETKNKMGERMNYQRADKELANYVTKLKNRDYLFLQYV